MKKVTLLTLTAFLFLFLTSFGQRSETVLISSDEITTSNIKPASIVPSEIPDDGARCVVVCPPEGIDEAEACGADINGGCNMEIPQFTAVSPGDVICGLAWYDGGTRDTDWFEMQITERTTITMTLFSDAQSFVFGHIEQFVPGVAGCGNITGSLTPYALAPGCTETSIEVTLDPGVYYFFVGLDFNGPIYDCALRSPTTYTVHFSGGPTIPISNWAIILGILLIGTFIVVRYRTRLV